MASTRGPALVDVLVHHRHAVAVEGATVRVVLLQHALAASPDDGAALSVGWGTKVRQALTSGGAPTGGWGLTDGWSVVDAAQPVRAPAGPVHPRTPRAVTFNLDLATAAAGTRLMLVAIAASTVDLPPAFSGSNLRDVVLRNHWVAARTLTVV